ncbi:iron permease FTR1/Fip1/EfeU [Lipomyces oligophaga]|uniref:iron permease FTR1/Fip1/EfeU n=1 Tax=Lipomyces oligophaga TaxID=45792 RepID=UPI0034CF600A
MANVFDVSVFFIVFRETLEAAIIISVLLAFLKQGIGKSASDPKVYRRLVIQVWVGSALGLLICLVVGGAFVGTWYSLGKDIWSNSENLWEGVFSLIATIIISIMGLAMLRLNKVKEKWQIEIAEAMQDSEAMKHSEAKGWFRKFGRKYGMAILPFVTILREGVEAIVFVGGVSLTSPATAFPIPVICGILAGAAVGFIIFFLIIATCFLYLVGAGLFSKSVWYFETFEWQKLVGASATESGSGAGSYDIRKTVWHVNCCNPKMNNNGGWMVFNALLGWTNSATYGSVISYNLYWIALCLCVVLMIFKEKKGHYPFLESFEKKRQAKLAAKKAARRAKRAEAIAASRSAADSISAIVSVSGDLSESSEIKK